MELFADPHFKTKYQKSKLRVKLWESDFMEKYGRKPNKNDIKEADMTIKEAYKSYWNLKTRALEESLTDITFCDETQNNVINNSPNKISVPKEDTNVINIEKSDKDAENIVPCNTSALEESNSVINCVTNPKVNEGVWGSHLSKSNEIVGKKKQTILTSRSSSFQLSQNKFTSVSFTKRNPRKSLSLNKVKSNSSLTKSNNDISIVDQESKDGFDINETTSNLFSDTFKIINEDKKPVLQSVNIVQQLVDGNINLHCRNIDEGWLNRCSKDSSIEFPVTQVQRLSGISNTSDSGIESTETNTCSPKTNDTLNNDTSLPLDEDEDFICNSDSEEEHKNKRLRNYRKRFSNDEFHVNKKPRLECNKISNKAQVINKLLIEPINSSNNVNQYSKNLINTMEISKVSNNERIISNNKTVFMNHDTSELISHKLNIPQDSNLCTNFPKETEKYKSFVCNTLENTGPSQSKETVNISTKKTISQISRKNLECNEDVAKPVTSPVQKRKSTKKSKKETNTVDVNTDSKINQKKRAPRKSKSIKMAEESIIRNSKVRRRTSKVNDKITQEEEPQDDPDTVETERGEIQIYGVESLKVVPRIPIRSVNSGDLIADFSKSVANIKTTIPNIIPTAGNSTKLTDKEKLEKKLSSGQINDNFVRINLKKKVYVRGKKSFNFSKYKKGQWKQRKKDLGSSAGSLDAADLADKNGVSTCFKCGDIGHFARYCPAMKKGDELLPLNEVDDDVEYPTLEEAAKMAKETAVVAHSSRLHTLPQTASTLFTLKSNDTDLISEDKEREEDKDEDEDDDLNEFFINDDFAQSENMKSLPHGHHIPDELLTKLFPPQNDIIEPLYKVKTDNTLIDTPTEVFEALKMFGHTNFRPGQETAVMRILSGLSTLVTLSTGSGKSLCYQLPAYLYSKKKSCITIVISPLVSLMDDQVTGIAPCLRAAALHTNLSPKIKDNVMQMVKEGNLDVLLISPEAVVAGEKSTGFGALLRQLPPIAFACIDEAHCISQWSHNFRPCYLMLCRVLKEKLGVKTILGLTATATKTSVESIVKHLDIPDGMNGVIADIPMSSNLLLTVSKDEYKDQALVTLLKSERFKECDSVIVYCTRRDECLRIAGLLRVSLQDPRNPENPNVKISAVAEAYHAGLSSHRRKIVQKSFMNGGTRIIVATVAFGMGINKPNIRSVIHYNMPGSFEGYVQEVGRAGRDGLPAQCHLFLNPHRNADKWELQRHINANGVDRHTIRRLLQKIFMPCSCKNLVDRYSGRRCPGHEVAIPIDETVRTLDITEETISTLLCYLELHPRRYISVLSSVYINARVSSYKGPQALKQAAQSSPPLAMAMALKIKENESNNNISVIEFPIVEVSSAIGWDSGIAKSHLKNLEWTMVNGQWKRTAISVRYDTLGLRVKAPGDLSETELDEALDALYNRTQNQENSCLLQLDSIHKALSKFSQPSIQQCLNRTPDVAEKSESLKDVIRSYFRSDLQINNDSKSQIKLSNEAEIANDVRSLVLSYKDNNFTGRAVARIFHGIQSPNYPAIVWSKCRFWRSHLSSNFNAICQIATREILALR